MRAPCWPPPSGYKAAASLRQGSVVAPADCDCTLAVGAVDQRRWASGPIEPYSSQGPTTDGRSKPDLVGPDRVTVWTAEFNPFVGTSAAAPHVAGAAALFISGNPGLGASALESRLVGEAIPMGASTQFGSGRLNLVAQTVRRPDLVIRNPGFIPRTPRVGDTITVTAELYNQGEADAGPFTVELRDSSGSLTQNVSGLPAGGALTVSFHRQVVATSSTLTLTADPLNQVDESDETNNAQELTVTAYKQPTLSIEVLTDRSGYRVGEPIRVEFTTGADGSVYLYDVDAQGRVNLLFPRAESGSAFLRAGTYDLTSLLGVFRLMVSEPAGREHLHGVLSSGAIALGLDGEQNRFYTDPNRFRSVINQRVQARDPSLT